MPIMHLKYTSIENVEFMGKGQVWPNFREGALLAVTQICLKKLIFLRDYQKV